MFCDSCCVLPQDANPNQFLNAAKGNFGGKAVGSKPEIDSAIGLRVCDGEYESTQEALFQLYLLNVNYSSIPTK